MDNYYLEALIGNYIIRLDQPTLVIGRYAVGSEYLRPRMYVSRFHAEITSSSDGIYIRNLSSINKTFVNGEPIQDTAFSISVGDEIWLGGKYQDEYAKKNAAFFVLKEYNAP